MISEYVTRTQLYEIIPSKCLIDILIKTKAIKQYKREDVGLKGKYPVYNRWEVGALYMKSYSHVRRGFKFGHAPRGMTCCQDLQRKR